MSAKKEMIAILDYSSALVHLGYIDEDKDVEEYMKENGFDFDACFYMIADRITLEKCI
jgi:hypothetical protein